jgi:ribonuclease HI
MHFDGSLRKEGAHGDLVFTSSSGEQLRYVVQLNFQACNNVAEYEALVNGLHIVVQLGVRRLDIRGDSHLIIGHEMK